MLDIKICQSITSLVEKITTTGKQELDTTSYKQLVSFAGQSEEYLKFCLEKLLQQLETKHAEVRFGAFLVIDELFRKSEYFRELLLDDFHMFLELTVESNPAKLLPPPIHVAKRLKQQVLQSIQKWYSLFGVEHKRISLGYNFIKNSLKVDFDDALKRNATELHKQEMERQRTAKFMMSKVKALKVEMDEHVGEISRVVTEMSNCFCLLIPKPEDLFGCSNAPTIPTNSSDDSDDDNDESVDLRHHGLTDPNFTLAVNLNPRSDQLRKTEDNDALIDNLKDFYVLLKNRYLPLIKKWVQIATKADDSPLFRSIMDLKDMVEGEMSRFEELKLENVANSRLNDEDSDSDTDFIEVPAKEDYEAEVVNPPSLVAQPSSTLSSRLENSSTSLNTWGLWAKHDNLPNDPTTIHATLENLKQRQLKQVDLFKKQSNHGKTKALSTCVTGVAESSQLNSSLCPNRIQTRKEKLLKKAPRLPYDVDLYHWEDQNLKAPSIEVVVPDTHRFWQPSDREGESIEAPDGVASLRTRVIEFSGTFEPVKWSCRTLLPSGKLCPRKDRYKCPLHGKIIARDEIGNPTKPEDIAELLVEKEKADREKPPDWQDPEFLKDIQAEIGIDLTVRPPKKGKRKKTFAETYPGLTDIDKKKNTPRTRLEKKVFNRGSLKRVAETLDCQNRKKFLEKFGDQWNYSSME